MHHRPHIARPEISLLRARAAVAHANANRSVNGNVHGDLNGNVTVSTWLGANEVVPTPTPASTTRPVRRICVLRTGGDLRVRTACWRSVPLIHRT